MRFKKITPSQWSPTPWKNDGGSTVQLGIFPATASLSEGNYTWRVSLATAMQSGPFSLFPGYDRVLAVLSDRPLVFRHDDEEGSASQATTEQIVRPLEPYCFSGDDKTYCTLLSGEAKDSCEIKRFVSTPDCKILIVVARGVLGFNMPELGSVIDMTGSHNIDRLFQLMSRVIRKHPEVKKKLFLKLTNKETYAKTYFFMSASVSLCLRDNFEKYDGTIKSLMNLNVVVSPDVKRKIKRMGDDGGTRSSSSIQPFSLSPILRFTEVVRSAGDVRNRAFITLSDVKRAFREESQSDKNKELLLRMARSGQPRPQMKNKDENYLASKLHQYIRTDPAFRAQIMQNSTWKFLRPEESKSELLALAKEGLTKKELRKKRRDLYVRFGKYIRPMSNGKTNSTYDGEFHKKIKEVLRTFEWVT